PLVLYAHPSRTRRIRTSQPVARPQRPRFERGDDFLGKTGAAQRRESARFDPLGTAAEPPALGGNQRHGDGLAVALAQCSAQIADPVDEAHLLGLAAGPIFAAEEARLVAVEGSAAAAFHQIDKAPMNILLDRLEVRDVLGLLRLERVE